MIQYLPKPYESFGGDTDIDLFNYARKTDLKSATEIDASKLTAKWDLVSLKAEVDKLDIEKLLPVSVDLSWLSYVVKNDVVNKTDYDKLDAKVNNIDTSRFVLKSKYDKDKSELEKKILILADVLKIRL